MKKISLDKFNEFIKLNKLQEAEIEINKLLLIDNNNHLLLSYLGNLLFHKGKILDAIEKFKQSINIKPEYYQNYSDISLCFIPLKKFDEVIFFLKEYIKYKNDNCDVYNNLGLAFLETNKLDDAVNCFNKCLSLKFDYIQAYNNLGSALLKKDKVDEAILILEQGIKIDNKFNSLYFNLARCFIKKNKIFKAIKILEEHLENNKSNIIYLNLLAECFLNIGKIEEGFFYLNKSSNIYNGQNIYNGKLLNFFYKEKLDLKNYFNEVNQLIDIYKKSSIKNTESKFFNFKDSIKIGFVSADFRSHAVSFQVFDVLKIFSENKNFEIFIYSNNDADDEITNDYKKFLNNWYNVKDFSDEKLVNLVRSNNIEILVDLSGFTRGHRMPVFYNKAAPIQVTWCGYLASTGLKEIDYIIADKHSVLSGDESKYSEKVYKLSKTWSVLKPIKNVYVNEKIPVLENKFISFGSFNNIKKINYKVIQLWCKILNSIKDSRLHLIDKNFSDKEFDIYFRDFFNNNGVKNEQLFFHESTDRIKLLKMYNSIDIALDPFPYSGGTTSLESYWTCVPVLTKKGDYFISKSTESINRNIGLDNWIANDEHDYLSRAISFSKDLNFLQNTKSYLINNKNKFAIFDSENLAEELSLAFKSMLKNYKSA